MSKLIQHTGIVLPLNIDNIDTDNIIPKQFLQETTRSNFGKYLFFNWRFLDNTSHTLNPNCIFNNPNYLGASILLTRKNFGCGSSREHAVWALIDYGFRIIIALSFADIFYKNSFNNNLLLISLSESNIDSLFYLCEHKEKKINFTVNLNDQIIYAKNKKYYFEINDFNRNLMINNLDRTNLTLQHDSLIQEYENNQLEYLK